MHIERPLTIEQALVSLDKEGVKAIAGGTNVMVDIKKGREKAEYFISLDALLELKKIELKPDSLHIGSLVTFTMLEEFLEEVTDKNLKEAFRALKEAASHVGGPQIRNRGTVGGNILCASPSSDSVPALLVLNASLRLVRQGGERIVPLNGFVTGVRRTDIQKGELLYEIIIPLKKGKSCFYKAGTRNAMAISVVDEALYLELENNEMDKYKVTDADDNCTNQSSSVVKFAAIALGSVAPVVVRAPKTEALLIGKTAEDIFEGSYMNLIRETLVKEISPISDLRGEKEYRQIVAQNILQENLKNLLGGK